VLAALVLFGLVRRTLVSARMRDRFGAAATPLAFVTALIWLVHPLQTGSVTYIVQRVESLMGLFYLLTLYCAIRSAQDIGRTSYGWIAGAIVACALGMATKEAMVTAPLMVLLWDWTFGASSVEARPPSRWPLYVGLAATWIIVAALTAAGPRAHSVGFGILAPTSSVVPIMTEIAAEHRMYLPLAAIIAVGVIGTYAMWPPKRPRLILAVSAGAVVAAFAFLTDARNRDYHDYERIWLDT